MSDLPSLPGVHGLFGSLDDVTLKRVEAFLAEAGEEVVTWEAKADDETRQRPEGQAPGRLGKNTIRKAVSGLANQIGGYLIIGARWDRKQGRWLLPGVVIDHEEPELWLNAVIDGGVAPVPPHGVKAWAIGDGRAVALIEIEPVAEPPCMTSQGHVYERVSGETRRVTDPAHLDALFRRGREARILAETRAQASAQDLASALDIGDGHGAVALAVAPIGRETDDISSQLFTQPFIEMAELALRNMLPKPGQPDQVYPSIGQAAVTTQAIFHEPLEPHEAFDTPFDERPVRAVWATVARWDGAVAAGASFAAGDVGYVSMFDEVIEPAWAAILPLISSLGGFGPARLAIVVVGAGPTNAPSPSSLLAQLTGSVLVQRAVDLGLPTGDQIGSIQREVQRSAGIFSFEPDPSESS